jgi:hypothetical protein
MNIALRKSMGVDAFLDWEKRQELRYEFDGFQPTAMTGERRSTRRSSAICSLPLGRGCAANHVRSMAMN